MRRTVVAGLAMLGVAACTGDPGPPAPPVDRLVVVDGSAVVTMDRDGSDRVVLADEPGSVPFQPVWSPEGDRVAYSTVTDGDVFEVWVADAGGSGSVSAESVTNVFYLQWSPSGDAVAVLRNHVEGGVALDVVDVADDLLEVRQVDDGDSYYLMWSPDGADMAVHVGADRFEVLAGEETTPLEAEPGSFQAPFWNDDGVVGIRRGDASAMVVRYQRDGSPEELVEVAGPTSFLVSPDGRRIALQSLATDTGVVEASLRQPAVEDRLRGNRAYVVDLASGEVSEVLDRLVTGFWWSPDGERLAVLYAPRGSAGRFTWLVWEDGEVTEGPLFRPLSSWAQELVPFVDQYNRSMTPWSPDSTSLAFPGVVGEEPGIWVVEVGGEPVKVSDGSWVAWSWS